MLTANMKMIAECADKLAHLGEKLFNETEMKTIKTGYEPILHIPTAEEPRNVLSEIAWYTTGEYECPEGYEFRDENGNVIEAKKIVLEKKKPKCPESACECCIVLGAKLMRTIEEGYKGELMKQFQLLITCRDAYWYCYAKETNMPFNWKPDWAMYSKPKHCIIYSDNEIKWQGKHFVTEAKVLAFPTAEMRDAFYENFKELIEVCKELL